MGLLTCQSCARHVKAGSAACPFCGERVVSTAPAPSPERKRVGRAALIAGAASVAVACSASDSPVYGAPPYDPYDAGNQEAGMDAGVPFYGGPPIDAGKEDAGQDAAKDAAVKDASADAQPVDSGTD